MSSTIEFRSFGEPYYAGLILEIADEIQPYEDDFSNNSVEVKFSLPPTVLYTGFVETLIIAISGGVATHLISKIIDCSLKVIRRRKEDSKAKSKSKEIQPSSDNPLNLNINLDSDKYELSRLNEMKIVIQDIDINIEFKIPEEKQKCMKHFKDK